MNSFSRQFQKYAAKTVSSRAMLCNVHCKLAIPYSTTTFSPSTTNSAPNSAICDEQSTVDPLSHKSREWFILGNNLVNEIKYKEAIDAYEKSIWSKPTADAFYNLANCLYAVGKYTAATESWEKSINLDPNQPDAHLNTANVYALSLKDYKKALQHYEQAVKLSTQDGEIRFNYAAVLEMEGRLEDAIAQYETAHKLGVERALQNVRNVKAKIMSKEK